MLTNGARASGFLKRPRRTPLSSLFLLRAIGTLTTFSLTRRMIARYDVGMTSRIQQNAELVCTTSSTSNPNGSLTFAGAAFGADETRPAELCAFDGSKLGTAMSLLIFVPEAASVSIAGGASPPKFFGLTIAAAFGAA